MSATATQDSETLADAQHRLSVLEGLERTLTGTDVVAKGRAVMLARSVLAEASDDPEACRRQVVEAILESRGVVERLRRKAKPHPMKLAQAPTITTEERTDADALQNADGQTLVEAFTFDPHKHPRDRMGRWLQIGQGERRGFSEHAMRALGIEYHSALGYEEVPGQEGFRVHARTNAGRRFIQALDAGHVKGDPGDADLRAENDEIRRAIGVSYDANEDVTSRMFERFGTDDRVLALIHQQIGTSLRTLQSKRDEWLRPKGTPDEESLHFVRQEIAAVERQRPPRTSGYSGWKEGKERRLARLREREAKLVAKIEAAGGNTLAEAGAGLAMRGSRGRPPVTPPTAAKAGAPQGAGGTQFEGMHPRGRGGKWIAKGQGLDQPKGDDRVKELQQRLHELGFQTTQDGQFGIVTEEAVKAFQKKYGLDPTGKVDEATVETMRNPPPIDAATARRQVAAEMGQQTKAQQQAAKLALNDLGYEYDTPEEMARSLRMLQRQYGLDVSGKLDKRTQDLIARLQQREQRKRNKGGKKAGLSADQLGEATTEVPEEGIMADEIDEAAGFDPSKHPRGRGGQWAHVIGQLVHDLKPGQSGSLKGAPGGEVHVRRTASGYAVRAGAPGSLTSEHFHATSEDAIQHATIMATSEFRGAHPDSFPEHDPRTPEGTKFGPKKKGARVREASYSSGGSDTNTPVRQNYGGVAGLVIPQSASQRMIGGQPEWVGVHLLADPDDRTPSMDDFFGNEPVQMPPNLRESADGTFPRCGTCVHFNGKRLCANYSAGVDRDDLCDSWLTLSPPQQVTAAMHYARHVGEFVQEANVGTAEKLRGARALLEEAVEQTGGDEHAMVTQWFTEKGMPLKEAQRAATRTVANQRAQEAISGTDSVDAVLVVLTPTLSSAEWAALDEAADSMAKATKHEPVGKKGLWGHKGLQLPAYIQHIANDLMEKRGKSESSAIAIAIGAVKRWARGGGNVDAGTKAAAAKAVAEWEKLKATHGGKKLREALLDQSGDEEVEETWYGVEGLPPLVERVAKFVHYQGGRPIAEAIQVGVGVAHALGAQGDREAAAVAQDWSARRQRLGAAALTEAALTAEQRKKLPKSAFAIPERDAYPIHDESHARAALTRVAQHGSPEEKKRVRSAVKRKHPGIDVAEAEALDARDRAVVVAEAGWSLLDVTPLGMSEAEAAGLMEAVKLHEAQYPSSLHFDPRLHPRGRTGQFTDVLSTLMKSTHGAEVTLPHGVAVRRSRGGHGLTVSHGQKRLGTFSNPGKAAEKALAATGIPERGEPGGHMMTRGPQHAVAFDQGTRLDAKGLVAHAFSGPSSVRSKNLTTTPGREANTSSIFSYDEPLAHINHSERAVHLNVHKYSATTAGHRNLVRAEAARRGYSVREIDRAEARSRANMGNAPFRKPSAGVPKGVRPRGGTMTHVRERTGREFLDSVLGPKADTGTSAAERGKIERYGASAGRQGIESRHTVVYRRPDGFTRETGVSARSPEHARELARGIIPQGSTITHAYPEADTSRTEQVSARRSAARAAVTGDSGDEFTARRQEALARGELGNTKAGRKLAQAREVLKQHPGDSEYTGGMSPAAAFRSVIDATGRPPSRDEVHPQLHYLLGGSGVKGDPGSYQQQAQGEMWDAISAQDRGEHRDFPRGSQMVTFASAGQASDAALHLRRLGYRDVATAVQRNRELDVSRFPTSDLRALHSGLFVQGHHGPASRIKGFLDAGGSGVKGDTGNDPREDASGLLPGETWPQRRARYARLHAQAGSPSARFSSGRQSGPAVENGAELVSQIKAGTRVTILTPQGQERSGRAVMRSSSGGWVLNMGGAHGTPGLVDERNIVRLGNKRKLREVAADVVAALPVLNADSNMAALLKAEEAVMVRLPLAELLVKHGPRIEAGLRQELREALESVTSREDVEAKLVEARERKHAPGIKLYETLGAALS